MTTETGPIQRFVRRAKRISLRWQICGLTGLAVLVSMCVLGTVGFSRSQEAVTSAKLDMLDSETGVGRNVIEQNLEVTRNDILQTPKYPPIPGIIRCLDNDGMDPDPLQTGSTTDIWIKRLATIVTAQMSGHPERLRTTLVEVNGQELARVERAGNSTRVVSDDRRFFEPAALLTEALAARSGTVTFSAATFDELAGRRVVHLATPFADDAGKTRGALIVSLDIGQIFARAADRIPSGSTDIVNETGQYVFCEDYPEYARSGRDYSLDKPVRASFLAESSKQNYRRLIPGSERPDGVSLIAIYQKIYYAGADRSRFWAVAPSIDGDTALAQVNALGRSLIWLGVFVIVACAAFTFVASKGLTSALQQLTRTADRFAQGDLDAEDLTNDPMGEVRDLQNSLAKMQ
jgi:HAMP domain-containing protein